MFRSFIIITASHYMSSFRKITHCVKYCASFVSITFTYRYYGMKKHTSGGAGGNASTKVLPAASTATSNGATKKVVPKPIITVTEFTPGNTPTDKVSLFLKGLSTKKTCCLSKG